MKVVRESGFALVEMLVVIVILGVLAGIVVFVVGNISDDASKNACATEAQSFLTAMQGYRTAAAHPNQLPHGANLAEVTTSLFNEHLLSSERVKYGMDGTASADRWGYDVGTGVVTPHAATCRP